MTLSMVNYWRHANQKYNEASPGTTQNDHYQKAPPETYCLSVLKIPKDFWAVNDTCSQRISLASCWKQWFPKYADFQKTTSTGKFYFHSLLKILKCLWKLAQHREFSETSKSKLQWEITLHQCERPSSKSWQKANVGEGVEKREHFYGAAGM